MFNSNPHFSIGDTVMIVDTGEIGTYYSRPGNGGGLFFINGTYVDGIYIDSYDKIVKIPSDLLPILQD